MTGASASGGRSLRTCATFDWTCVRAALAPTYAVVTFTTAMSVRGNCRTDRDRIACSPAIRITRLTTMARTGRRTKRSVNFMFAALLAVFGFRSRVVAGLRLVVDLDGGAVAELEDARGHDFLPLLEAGGDRDLVSARGAELDDLLAHAAIDLAVGLLQVRHDEDGVAVRRVVDRGGRERDDRLARRQKDPCVHEHAGLQLPLRVRERGLDLDVAGRLIHDRVERGDLAGELRGRGASGAPGSDAHSASHSHAGDLLLGHGEVHVDRIEGLERHDRGSPGQVLTEVDLANPQDPGERRPDGLPFDRGADLADLGSALRVFRRGLVIVRLGNDSLLEQATHPVEIDAGELLLRLRRGQLRALLPRVQLHEDGALPDRLPGIEVDLVHDAGQVRADRDAVHRGHGSDLGEVRRPLLLPGHDLRHGLGGRLKRRVLLDGLL